MRIGVSSVAANSKSVDDVVAEAKGAAADGFQTFWASQVFGNDALTALAVVGREVPGMMMGTSVVPTYPRHPMMLAQQALTVQSATGGRLRLGIGLSHQIVVESMWGMSFEKPVRHLREYLSVLMPLLDGKPVGFAGETYQVNGSVAVEGAGRPEVIVAALGAQMLRLAGTHTDGTTTWCVGPKTLVDFTIPQIRQAAADAQRPEPVVVSAFPVCVTDDPDGARALAAKVFAIYGSLPSYRAMMDREGVADASGLAIVGSETEVRQQIEAIAEAGVTDFNAGMFSTNPEEIDRTRAVLRELM